ncbi:MAG: hypothetical protein H0V82_02805 [Candidatus Protochlamydia sp.]|nr:hypothetical protein [Candidatus Protochlamydia sp.]
MAKKRSRKLHTGNIVKKTSYSALIALFIFIIFKLAETIQFPLASFEAVNLPAQDTPLKLYSNQTDDNLSALYIKAIESASVSITFVIYALMDPEIIQALNKRADAGISVHLVCDAKASLGISRKIPKATIVKRLGKGLMHQKILIIDQQQVVLGSANMTSDSLRVHGNLVMAMHHPPLARTLLEKAHSMNEEGYSHKLSHLETVIAAQKLELWMLPDDHLKGVQRMIELFRSAKKTIRVAMFTWTRNDFTQELIAAAKRGVKVEAVVDRYSGSGASSETIRALCEAKIPVRLNTGQGLLHHKFAWIDDTILVNGSANWTQSAFKVNDDVFIILQSLSLDQQAKMSRLWECLQRKSERTSPKAAKKRKSYVDFYEEAA